MFGKNQIVGKKFFKDANGKYFVTTIFTTLQGEGPYAGCPAIFIRLAKCNLACSFCDTYFDDGDWFTNDELIKKIEEKVPAKYKKKEIGIVITGGEPSLQDLYGLTLYLNHHYKWCQIESNGILAPNYHWMTTLVVSPKCAEKNGKAIGYIKPHEQSLIQADCLKFVISADPNSLYHTIPDWAFEWKKTVGGDIYISPMNIYNAEPQWRREHELTNKMGIDERSVVNEVVSFWEKDLLNLEQNQANHEYAAKYCLENNLRLNLQMHLYASLA